MWWKKIKRRKLQFLFIGFILMISTAILVACISFTLETKKYVDDYYRYDKSPIYFDLIFDKKGLDILQENLTTMQYLDKLELSEAKYVKDEFFKGSHKLSNDSILVYALDDIQSLGYSLSIAQGEEKECPGDGEIWVCHTYAKAVGLHVGDELTIGDKEGLTYTVTTIVNTPECSSGFIDNYPCYVNSSTLSNMTGVKAYGICMYAKANVTIKELNEALPEEYKKLILSSIDRETLKLCLSILPGIFGGVGIAAALLILGVSIIVIRYMVRSVIDKEYHMIGIYKAMGRSNTEIRTIYFLSYMVTGLIGIMGGLILGRPLAIYLGNEILSNMKGFRLSYLTNLISLFVMIFMAVLLMLNIWLELKILKQITPVQAMAVGVKSTRQKLCKSVIKYAHHTGAMAINRIFKEKGKSLLIIMVLTVSYYICLMTSAVGLSLSNYTRDRDIWENLPDYDGYINIVNKENIADYLKNSPYVKDYVEFTLSPDNINMSFNDCDLTKNEANPMVYKNFTSARYADVPFTAGRICTNPHEITVSEQFLKKAGRAVGDYIKIDINGVEINFLIVGSYSAMMRGGVSFYIQAQDLLEAGAIPDLSTVMFFLKDGISYEKFARDFKNHFSDSKIYQDFDFIKQEGRTVNDISVPICIVLFAAFAVFSFLNIVNVIYTQNRENKKKYGILKAVGFTAGYIYRETMIGLTIESAVAILITILLHETLSPVLFSLACGIHYICKPVWLTAIVCTGIYLCIMILTIIMLLPVRKITPVELMEE